MKINQIPDIYIEQYILGELPENLRKEMDELILQTPELNERIMKIKKSDREILAKYPAEMIAAEIEMKSCNRKSAVSINSNDGLSIELHKKTDTVITGKHVSPLKNLMKHAKSLLSQRHTLSIASAAALILVMIFMIPGIFNISNTYNDDVRIKGLESKLLVFRMKGKDIEELRNLDIARSGDIIQVGYIAAGNFTDGVILSIDGRGTVTMHMPESGGPSEKLVLNRKILLNRSYELDDSPSFERFIMILNDQPIDTGAVIEKAKKLAKSRDNAVNGLIDYGKNSAEFSVTIKKSE